MTMGFAQNSTHPDVTRNRGGDRVPQPSGSGRHSWRLGASHLVVFTGVRSLDAFAVHANGVEQLSIQNSPGLQRGDHIATDVRQPREIKSGNIGLILENEDGFEPQAVRWKCESTIVVSRALSRFGICIV